MYRADLTSERILEIAGMITDGMMNIESYRDVTAQRKPIHHFDSRPVTEQVIADLEERTRVGRIKYGCPLSTFNGRSALTDAYQESLDLAQYLKQALMEGEKRSGIDSVTIGDLKELKAGLEGKGARMMASSGVINSFALEKGITYEEAEWLSFVARTIL